MKRMRVGGLVWLVTFAVAGPAWAADLNPLWGHWRLISAVASFPDKPVQHAFGEHPSGSLIYTPEGRVSVLISYEGRPRLTGERSSAPLEERAQAFATFFAYAGTYEVKGNTVTHRLEVASDPNSVGLNLVRTYLVDGDRLTLKVAPRVVGGQLQSDELTWQRTR